tara:strand:+ start:19858 stop:20433 length:576 start_codon:yes stop_codon:yes gene_type:complete
MKVDSGSVCRVDDEHRLQTVTRRIASPYYDARPIADDIRLVVIHAISLPPDEFGGPWIDDLFAGTLDFSAHPYFETLRDMRVSAHLCIFRDGSISQYVPFDQRAWHAGKSSWQGREVCNDFSIGIELEGCDTQPFEPVQYEQLARSLKALFKRYPHLSSATLAGHSDIAPDRKTDPGPHFDWSLLRSLLLG